MMSDMIDRKATLSAAVVMTRASAVPAMMPTSTPGAIVFTVGQSTAPCRWWVRKLAHAPDMIAASEVPIAMCIT